MARRIGMADGESEADRRLHPRFDAGTYRVHFKKLDQPDPGGPDAYELGEVVDISKGGMRFRTEHSLSDGDWIQYYVDSPSGKSGREGTAHVVRVEEEPPGIRVAVRFL